MKRSPLVYVLLATAAVSMSGCSGCISRRTFNTNTTGTNTTGTNTTATDLATSTGPKPGVVEELKPLEPYDAPTLAELDEQANWVPRPVVDPMALRREAEQGHQPLVSVAEALRTKNNTPEDNEKILSALGPMATDDSAVDYEASISRRLTQDLRSMNPLLGSSMSEFEISGLTGVGLFGFDWQMNPFALANFVKEWHSSEDGKLDKVVMRDDLTWSDGVPITAHDIVFSFQTILDPEVPIPAVRQGTDEIRWIEAYDNQTLVYFHKEALATNIWNLNFPIIPKHKYESTLPHDKTMRQSEAHVAMESAPVTGGMYEVYRRTRGQEVVLRRREGWYMHEGKQVREKPYFKEIRFKIIEDANTALLALKKGDIDEAQLQAEQWQTQSGGEDYYRYNTKVSGVEWTFFYFGWNMNTPYFADVRVRRAMSYAFNHDEMLDVLCFGLYQPCTGIYHPEAWMAPQTTPMRFRQDLDKAEDLLDAAGWDDSDGDGVRDKMVNGRLVPFEFSMIVSNKPDRVRICELLRQDLESIGVICNVAPLEAATMQDRMFDRNFQAAMAGWGAGADPDTSQNIWGTGEGRNYMSYSSQEVDDLFKRGKREMDREKRAAIYARIHEIVYEDQPYTFLFYRSSFYGFNKKLRGYKFSPRGPFHYGPGFDAIWGAQQ